MTTLQSLIAEVVAMDEALQAWKPMRQELAKLKEVVARNPLEARQMIDQLISLADKYAT